MANFNRSSIGLIDFFSNLMILNMIKHELVEVFYNHKLDRIHKIQPLDQSSKRMNFYADQITINAVLSPQAGR